ncbi:MAG: triose-phosphate isomerase [Chloroflexi bacterium]|nr:triose-phosphate isomerase [Chloroflexota bacterium]
MRQAIVAGNWKMNGTVEEAPRLVKEMLPALESVEGVEKVVCPPFISLAVVQPLLRGTSVKLGAQNMHWEERGAYTGEVSPSMLVGLVQYVILGHSERRNYFGETDELVNRKLRAARKAGLRPILCVGERLEERKAGRAEALVKGQLEGALQDIAEVKGLVVAYEPVWAIGTGVPATGETAQAMMSSIRGMLFQRYGEYGGQVSLLYGGSVTAANMGEFASQADIDGALVGGASLKPAEFVDIVRTVARHKTQTAA